MGFQEVLERMSERDRDFTFPTLTMLQSGCIILKLGHKKFSPETNALLDRSELHHNAPAKSRTEHIADKCPSGEKTLPVLQQCNSTSGRLSAMLTM